MPLFGNKAPKETKEEKQERKQQEMLAEFGLNELSDQKDIDSVLRISLEMNGTNLSEFDAAIGKANERDFAKMQMHFQRAIIEQNFIMIRQLDRIAKLLEKSSN